jgi:hypothetical protein
MVNWLNVFFCTFLKIKIIFSFLKFMATKKLRHLIFFLFSFLLLLDPGFGIRVGKKSRSLIRSTGHNVRY